MTQSLITDELIYQSFLRNGVPDQPAKAFAHLFAYKDGKCKLDTNLREKFEKIGLLDNYGNLHMDNKNNPIEWILLIGLYEGKIKRKWDSKDCRYHYSKNRFRNFKNTWRL